MKIKKKCKFCRKWFMAKHPAIAYHPHPYTCRKKGYALVKSKTDKAYTEREYLKRLKEKKEDTNV